MANRKDYKKLAKYDPLNWKSTGQNKFRKLDNIDYSLNEDDYDAPEDYDWDKMLETTILISLVDLAKLPTSEPDYKTAHEFIFTETLDCWCIAFGRNIDIRFIRSRAKKILVDLEYRESFLKHYHDVCKRQLRARGEQGVKPIIRDE